MSELSQREVLSVLDTHNGSRRSDVTIIGADKVGDAHGQGAQLRNDQADLERLICRWCERYDAHKRAMRAIGIVSEFMLSDELGAAYGAHLTKSPNETAIPLVQISEAPLPAEGE